MSKQNFEQLLAGAETYWLPNGNIRCTDETVEAKNAFIARCNPATMKVVWEALKSCEYRADENWGAQHRFDEDLVALAVALLNAAHPESKQPKH